MKLNKKLKVTQILGGVGIITLSVLFMSSDHIDAPAVLGATADLSDLYAYKSPTNPENIVFIANMQSNVPPGTNATSFDEDILVEFNIDNDGDLIEDLVIQAIARNGYMHFFGPYTPTKKGIFSEIVRKRAKFIEKVKISPDQEAITKTTRGISYFAGRREDPFYLDANQFALVLTGQSQEPNGGFKEPNHEFTIRENNVLSIVIEVPNALLGNTFPHPIGNGREVINTWLTTSRLN